MKAQITRMLATVVLAISLTAIATTAVAGGPAGSLEGKYKLIKPPQPTADSARVEVIEFFAYDCLPCYRIFDDMQAFEQNKPAYVDVFKIPVFVPHAKTTSWKRHARAYYAAMVIGVAERTHRAYYEVLHVEKHKLQTRKAVAQWFEEQGVDRAAFETAYQSEEVSRLMEQTKQTLRRYRVRSVPQIVVNGKYRVRNKTARGYVDKTLYGNIVAVTQALAQREHEK